MLIAFYFKHIIFRVLLCLIVFTFFSCGPSGTNPKDKNAAHERLCKETFTKLRDMFPDPILDKDLKTLKKATSSKVYLDFLKKVYPSDKPFKTLDDFIIVSQPSTERYKTFLNRHFEKPTALDFANLHQLTLIYRRSNIMMIQAEQTKKPSYFKSALMARTRALSKEPLSVWWKSTGFSGRDRAELYLFFLYFDKFVSETEKADTDWIKSEFEAHGESDAMLWIAIRNPTLIGEIITNFSSKDLFLSWVGQKFILKKLSEFKKMTELKEP